MFDLEGKAALVTGASGGIGGAIARALHARGARVALSGTRAQALEALAGELGERADVLTCDLSDLSAVDALPGRAETALGQLDILINNAGVTRDQLAMRMKDEDWDQVLAVNLTAGFHLMRGALRGMMRRRWGRIVSITSIVGTTGNPGQANYAASKAGLDAATRTWALELSPYAIRVAGVAPGVTRTSFLSGISEQAVAELVESTPLRRAADPAEIWMAVRFILECGYFTGRVLEVDGGASVDFARPR
jgi:3-oxoacyl-[acyl-carrier protein] reductase